MVRKREIRQIGGSYYIKLYPSDLKDFNLKVKDLVIIDEISKPMIDPKEGELI